MIQHSTSAYLFKGNEITNLKVIYTPLFFEELFTITKLENKLSVHQWMNG